MRNPQVTHRTCTLRPATQHLHLDPAAFRSSPHRAASKAAPQMRCGFVASSSLNGVTARSGRHAPSSLQPAGLAKVVKGPCPGTLSTLSEVVLDAEKLVVLSNTLGTSRCTSLDLASVIATTRSAMQVSRSHWNGGRQLRCNLRLANLDSLEGLGRGTNLVDLTRMELPA